MDWDINRVISLIKRGKLSHVVQMRIMLYYAKVDRSILSTIVKSTSRFSVDVVYDILTMYPRTERGWEALPAFRSECVDATYTPQENADIDNLLFQEDREYVEFLRDDFLPKEYNSVV